jgi:hypothetical protein
VLERKKISQGGQEESTNLYYDGRVAHFGYVHGNGLARTNVSVSQY